MAHNGSTVAANVHIRWQSYEHCGVYTDILEAQNQGDWRMFSTAVFENSLPGDQSLYVDQATGAFAQPPAGYVWGSTWQGGFWGLNEDRWVITWTGVCQPEISVSDWQGPGSMVYLPAESGPNRRVFKISGTVPVTREMGPWRNWPANKTGLTGINLACKVILWSQSGPVSNIKIYRLEDEPRVLQGKRFSQAMIDTTKAFGMLRFMDTIEVNHAPHFASVDQIMPPGWRPSMQHLYRGGSDMNRITTQIGENHWEVQTRSGKPSIEHGLAVRFSWAPVVKGWRVVSKGATTQLRSVAHGMSNGDLLQRVVIYYYDGRAAGSQWGWPDPMSPDGIDPTTGLSRTWPVTVVDQDTITIPYNSTNDAGVVVGGDYAFMRPIRLRYGGVDVYAHDGIGGGGRNGNPPYNQTPDQWFPVAVEQMFGSPTNGYFVIPHGRGLSHAYFLFNCKNQRHPEDMVELCNEVGAHAWLPMPNLASNAVYDFFATYFRDNLAAGLEVMWESGNENWNFGFSWQGLLSYYGQRSLPSGYWDKAHGTRTKVMMKRVQAAYAGSGRIYHGYLQIQAGGWMLAPERGFYDLDDPNGTGTDRPIDNVDYIGGAPYWGGSSNTIPIEDNYWGELFDNYLNASTPGFAAAVKAFKDDTRPWGEKINGLQFLTDNIKTKAMLCMEKWHIESPTGAINTPGHIGNAAKRFNKKIACYEGGSHFAADGIKSGFDGSPGVFGVTEKDVSDYFWEWRHWIGGEAEVVRSWWTTYREANPRCEWPMQYTMGPGRIIFDFNSWSVRSAYSPYWRSIPSPSFDAYVELGGSQMLRANLSGRGYLTAALNGTWGTTASLSGGGVLSATAEITQQQFISGLTDYGEELVLNYLFRATATSPASVYLALHNGSTGEQGATNEVSGGDYVRKAITFDAPSGGATVNSGDVVYDEASAPWGDIVAFSLWDADTGGNCLATGAFTGSKTVSTGDKITVPAGGITITAN